MGCSVTALQRYSGFLNGVFLCNKNFINIYIYIYILIKLFFLILLYVGISTVTL